MTITEGRLNRADLLKAGAAGALGLTFAGQALARTARIQGTTLNMLTWSDHYANDQLSAVAKATGLQGRPTLFSDNADAYLKIKQTGSQFDIVSGDALWVPKYNKDGLTISFPLDELPVSKQLYPIARQFPFWKDGSNYMGYPFSWSTVQIYYNPKYVNVKPTSWHALLNSKYKGKISLENIPTDVMAIAGRAIGAKQPYSMTSAEIGHAKDFLKQLKPNVLKLVSQNTEVVRALTDGSAWLTIENLGTDARVRDAKGPLILSADPKEGLYGWMDAEMLLKASHNQDSFEKFITAMEQAPYIAKNFLTNGRPLFNEKAYKILVNTGHKERADRFFYNHPERPLSMTLKGPSGNAQAYIDAFNEVFAG